MAVGVVTKVLNDYLLLLIYSNLLSKFEVSSYYNS